MWRTTKALPIESKILKTVSDFETTMTRLETEARETLIVPYCEWYGLTYRRAGVGIEFEKGYQAFNNLDSAKRLGFQQGAADVFQILYLIVGKGKFMWHYIEPVHAGSSTRTL